MQDLESQKRSTITPYLACVVGSALAERAQAQGFHNLLLLQRPWYKVENFFTLRHFINIHSIDLVDAHSSKAHNLALAVKYLGSNFRLLVHRRVDYAPKSKGPGAWKYRSNRIDGYIAISSAIGKILRQANIPPEKIFVVRSAIDSSFYASLNREEAGRKLRKKYDIADQELVVLAVGALAQQKRYDILIHALALLKKRRPQGWKAILLGEGPLREDLLSLRQRLGLEHDLRMPGFQNDVRESLRGADIFAHSAEYEGLGTILLDAASASCPIVTTAVGGIPEIVKDKINGLLVPSLDSQALADGLLTLVKDSALRNRYGEEGQRLVKEQFSLQAMVQGNLDTYKKFLF